MLSVMAIERKLTSLAAIMMRKNLPKEKLYIWVTFKCNKIDG
jgi:hypothetical protein